MQKASSKTEKVDPAATDDLQESAKTKRVEDLLDETLRVEEIAEINKRLVERSEKLVKWLAGTAIAILGFFIFL